MVVAIQGVGCIGMVAVLAHSFRNRPYNRASQCSIATSTERAFEATEAAVIIYRRINDTRKPL